jgi:hypothetical protein
VRLVEGAYHCELLPVSMSADQSVVNAGAVLMVAEKLAVAVALALSVTWTVKEEDPAAVGVPEMAPVAAFRASPTGSWPVVTVQES